MAYILLSLLSSHFLILFPWRLIKDTVQPYLRATVRFYFLGSQLSVSS